MVVSHTLAAAAWAFFAAKASGPHVTFRIQAFFLVLLSPTLPLPVPLFSPPPPSLPSRRHVRIGTAEEKRVAGMMRRFLVIGGKDRVDEGKREGEKGQKVSRDEARREEA